MTSIPIEICVCVCFQEPRVESQSHQSPPTATDMTTNESDSDGTKYESDDSEVEVEYAEVKTTTERRSIINTDNILSLIPVPNAATVVGTVKAPSIPLAPTPPIPRDPKEQMFRKDFFDLLSSDSGIPAPLICRNISAPSDAAKRDRTIVDLTNQVNRLKTELEKSKDQMTEKEKAIHQLSADLSEVKAQRLKENANAQRLKNIHKDCIKSLAKYLKMTSDDLRKAKTLLEQVRQENFELTLLVKKKELAKTSTDGLSNSNAELSEGQFQDKSSDGTNDTYEDVQEQASPETVDDEETPVPSTSQNDVANKSDDSTDGIPPGYQEINKIDRQNSLIFSGSKKSSESLGDVLKSVSNHKICVPIDVQSPHILELENPTRENNMGISDFEIWLTQDLQIRPQASWLECFACTG